MVHEYRGHLPSDEVYEPIHTTGTGIPDSTNGHAKLRQDIEVTMSHGVMDDNTLVSMGKVTMTAAQAYQNGFIKKDASGNYIDPGSLASQMGVEDAGEEEPDPVAGSDSEDSTGDGSGNEGDLDDTLLADPETEARLEEMTEAAGGSHLMEVNVLKALDGADSDKAMGEVGEALGLGDDPEAVRETAAQTYDGLYDAAVNHVESSLPDVNAAEAFEWAGQNMGRAEIIDAQIKWFKGDPSGLMSMVKAYQKRS